MVHSPKCASLTKMLLSEPPQPAKCDCGAVDWNKAATNYGFHRLERAQHENPLDKQIGGSHYKLPIQPAEYIHKNGVGFFEGNVIKYVTRWRNKGGLADLEKAKHYIEMLIEFEEKQHAAK